MTSGELNDKGQEGEQYSNSNYSWQNITNIKYEQ